MTDTPAEDLPEGVHSRTVNYFGMTTFCDIEGRLHNPDGPAKFSPDSKGMLWLITGLNPSEIPDCWVGINEWWLHGRLHRTDGPAIEFGDGGSQYWVDGRLHRTDGPAVENSDGTRKWFIHGHEYSEQAFTLKTGRNRVMRVFGRPYY